MKRFSSIRSTLALAMPVAASHVSDMVTHAADSIMVGTLGAVPLAAVTLAGASSIVVMLFGIGFSVAITPMAAAAWARGDAQSAAGIARSGTKISVLVSVVLVALLFAAQPLLAYIGAPSEVLEQTGPYYQWLVASYALRFGFGAFKQTTEALGNTRMPMILALAANVLNVVLNWVFIYGNLGAQAMGAEGAGIATFLSRAAILVVAWVVWRRSTFFAPLRMYSAAKATATEIRRLWVSGTEIGLQITLEVLGFAFGALLISGMGAIPLAAHQIAINLASITFMVALGLGTAGTILVSAARGTGSASGVRTAVWSVLALVLVYELATATTFIALRAWLPTLYVDDAGVISLAAHLLVFAAAFQVFDGLQAAGMGLLRGLNDTRIPTLISFFCYTVITMPTAYFLAYPCGLGATGVWIGYLVGLFLASIGYLYRIRTLTTKKHKGLT